MITNLKEIATESPIEEIWKNLRFFLHVDSVADAIFQLHKTENPRRSDVVKQAKQLAYCIRQAEEYFHASSQVDLPTRPNLLYYGAVSLSRALVLLRKNGEHSFDALRKSGRHNHHGLNLERTFKSMKPERPDIFFKAIQSSINLHSQPPHIPWGHFPIFYNSLVPPAYATVMDIHRVGVSSSHLKSTITRQCTNKTPIDHLPRKLNALDLMARLPDIFGLLVHLRIQPMVCDGANPISEIVNVTKDEAGTEQTKIVRRVETFLIDNVPKAESPKLVKFLKERNPSFSVLSDLPEHLLVQRTLQPGETSSSDTGYIPDIVPAINGVIHYILDPPSYIIEPASLFILLFGLGMLARYHPDIWMRAIDNVQIAELADSLLDVCYRKFPHLLLDQLTFTHHVLRIT